MAKGWICLNRQLQDHWLWQEKPFSRGQAWTDLIMLANYEDKKTSYKNKIVICKKGDVNLSFTELAKRWGWSRQKVSRFVNLLENDKMCTTNVTTHRTTITLIKYSFFQDMRTTNVTTNITTSITTNGRQTDITNNNNNINNITNTIGGISPSEIVNLFHALCPSYPKVNTVSNARKKAINARLKTLGLENIKKAFTLAEESDFLKGKNNRNWQANFDWIMADKNISKILDGNYNNKPTKNNNECDDISQIW